MSSKSLSVTLSHLNRPNTYTKISFYFAFSVPVWTIIIPFAFTVTFSRVQFVRKPINTVLNAVHFCRDIHSLWNRFVRTKTVNQINIGKSTVRIVVDRKAFLTWRLFVRLTRIYALSRPSHPVFYDLERFKFCEISMKSSEIVYPYDIRSIDLSNVYRITLMSIGRVIFNKKKKKCILKKQHNWLWY